MMARRFVFSVSVVLMAGCTKGEETLPLPPVLDLPRVRRHPARVADPAAGNECGKSRMT
jgi:hypothetical protein